MQYAVLNAEGQCVNRVLWDGVSPWNPPEGCQAVPDPDGIYSFSVSPSADEEETNDL